jgi:hypothetical protein
MTEIEGKGPGQHPCAQEARGQAQAQRCIREIDNNNDNIVITNSLAGDRNDAAPKYVE